MFLRPFYLMLIYVAKRLIGAIPTFLGVLTLVFVLMRLVPGDPAILILGERATPESVAALRADMGLDVPIWRQYVNFLGQVAQGDLGRSIRTNQPVFGEVMRVFPYTAALAVAAIVLASVFGVAAGVLAALRRNTVVDYVISSLSMVGIAMPVFTLGIILLLIFSYQLRWFPAISSGSAGSLGDSLWQLVLPAVALGLSSGAVVARMARSSVLEIMNQDFVRTARAKGVPDRSVTFKHVLKNAMIPVVTIIGINFGRLMSGTVITETLFVRPGLGRLMIDSIYSRDYPQVEATIAFFAIIFIVINLAVDVVYAMLDPRIQYG